ncbi:MAG: nuclear transport factor 2 family protein [Gemmatirosa sp.]
MGGGAQASRTAAPTRGGSAADSVGAYAAAQGFLAAFDSPQFDAFRGYFADDMTMFFPFPQFPARVDGRAGVEDIFGKFMTAQREARAKAGRPMVQGITARDLKVRMAGPDVAIVSVHLGAEATPARRSVVFRKDPGGWKVVHWHASSAPPAPNR